jgi:hypothetical protein
MGRMPGAHHRAARGSSRDETERRRSSHAAMTGLAGDG